MRTFLAIDLPDSIQAQLRITSEALRRLMPSEAVRWVKPESIHLTIKFIGEVQPDLVEKIVELATPVTDAVEPHTLTLSGLGAFPHGRKPRVIWLGFEEVPPPLLKLQQGLEASFATIGIAPEKRSFNPHLTLGRLRRGADRRQIEAVAGVLAGYHVGTLGQVTATRLTLFESKLGPQGAAYRALHHFEFKGGSD
jgi:2'-5' RNA ligase